MNNQGIPVFLKTGQITGDLIVSKYDLFHWFFLQNLIIMKQILGTIKCNADFRDLNHVHTEDCERILLEHVPSGTSTESKNIIPCEFPDYVMDAVEVSVER